MTASAEPVDFYMDFKSPYAFLAFDPVLDLDRTFDVVVRWHPFQLVVKSAAERSRFEEDKVRYLFLDARRAAERLGGLTIRGPTRIYDSTASLVGGLFADRHGCLARYGQRVFTRFFQRALEIDQMDAIAAVLAEVGLDAAAFHDYAAGQGRADYDAAQARAAAEHVFGVPFMLFRGEPFWGHDRIDALHQRLREAGRARDPDV